MGLPRVFVRPGLEAPGNTRRLAWDGGGPDRRTTLPHRLPAIRSRSPLHAHAERRRPRAPARPAPPPGAPDAHPTRALRDHPFCRGHAAGPGQRARDRHPRVGRRPAVPAAAVPRASRGGLACHANRRRVSEPVEATASTSSATLNIGAIAAATLLVVLTAFVSVLTVVIEANTCGATNPQSAPSPQAEQGIPANYLALYRDAGREYGVPWQVLAAIGSIETDHGRSTRPRRALGRQQLRLLRRTDAVQHCATGRPRPGTATASTATTTAPRTSTTPRTRSRLPPTTCARCCATPTATSARRSSATTTRRPTSTTCSRAPARYAGQSIDELATTDAAVGCSGGGLDVPGRPRQPRVSRSASPRRAPSAPCRRGRWPAAAPPSSSTPASTTTSSGSCAATACASPPRARAGHQTHGDGTAVDLIPADGTTQPVWDASAGRLAHDLGWTPGCARSGTRPACPLVPAIQFIGYDGYPSHGSPRTCTGTCPAHLHVSWASALLRLKHALATLRVGQRLRSTAVGRHTCGQLITLDHSTTAGRARTSGWGSRRSICCARACWA